MDLQRQFVLGTAGHIDHGKTALVKALTGVNTDRLPDEKLRGITIDLGFAALFLGSVTVGVVDVPGHERFIRNMLAGATGIDLALLVVAADDSVMPQTREHLDILKLLGVQSGLIAITKSDLVESSWLELVKAEVRELVRDSFLENAPIVVTSSQTGAGVDELKRAICVACENSDEKPDCGQFRMDIDRVFTVSGHGTVVTGTVTSGAVHREEELVLLPSMTKVKVKGLQQHDRPTTSASRGARVAINLGGVHHSEVVRGAVLSSPGYLQGSRVVGVRVSTNASAPRPLHHRRRYHLHHGTSEHLATLVLFDQDQIEPGEWGLGELHTAEPMHVHSGQPFVLRELSPAATLGGGLFLSPTGPKIRRGDRAASDRLERRGSSRSIDRLSSLIETIGWTSVPESALVREVGVRASILRADLDELKSKGDLVEIRAGGRRTWNLHRKTIEALEDRVVRVIMRHHAEKPRQSMIRRAHLASAFGDVADFGLIEAIIDRMIAARRLLGDNRCVALVEFQPKLSHSERKLKDELLLKIVQGSFSPLDVPALVSTTARPLALVAELLSLLVDEGQIVEISPGFYLSFDAESQLRRSVVESLTDGGSLTMSGLRDLLNTSRKYAVPIGEYLDRIGLTVRDGDDRRLKVHHEPERPDA